MVACHPGDLRAAAAAGLHTAYVPRPTESGEGNESADFPGPGAGGAPEFDVVGDDFPDLATKLGV
jgi:2-haloacid dehalogenase